MECPHLEESAKITVPSVKSENLPQQFTCSVCKTEKSPWICLCCGVVNCGRYVNGHARKHQEEDNERAHSVCMDCDSYSAFCYVCDEFVVNDTKGGHLEKLRKHLQSLNSPQSRLRDKSKRISQTDSVENNKRKKMKLDKDTNPRSSGLRNLGNTCFMNAVLQSLSNIEEFCGYIKRLPSLEDQVYKMRKCHYAKRTKNGEDVLLVEELRKTLIALWQGTKTAISPDSLFSVIWQVVPRFRGYQQQDAHEFMRYLLDRLHTELLTLLPYPNDNSPFIGPKGKSTIVTAIFGGLLQNEVNCLICNMESKKHDPFLDLSLDIPIQYCSKTALKSKESEGRCKLTDCLTSFTDIEELEESELYMCSNCKKKQHSTKKFWIRRLPNVLCLHLKRFRWNSVFRLKIETFVEFPIRGLDMNRYVLNNLHETRGSFSGSNLYDLAAVIVHHGSGAGSGHYTSYAIHKDLLRRSEEGIVIPKYHRTIADQITTGVWYHFNDSNVTVCNEETVSRCKAYILFYVRREFKLPENIGVNNKLDD